MAYTINLTDGTIFATVADGTINTSSSVTLVGKNYAGYGEFLDENIIQMLENFSNPTAPTSPLTGQLWWDKTNSLLKVYNGTTFKTISAATASGTAPASNVTGDLWYDTTNQQLKVWTGSAFLVVGPAYSSVAGTAGAIPETINDNTATPHYVTTIYVNNVRVAIYNDGATFTAAAPVSTLFPTVFKGVTMTNSSGTNMSGNLIGAGNVTISAGGTVTGTFTGSGANIAGYGNVTGNITGGNILTAGVVSATGNVTGANFIGNVIPPAGGAVSTTGNITGGNILTSGLISATSTITSAANITGGNILTAGVVSATGNVSGANFIGNVISPAGSNVSTTGNVTGGNILTGGLISAAGNITSNSFVLGNAFYMTGINAAVSVSQIQNGTSNVKIGTLDGNVTIGVGGTGNVIVIDSGTLYTAGLSAVSLAHSGTNAVGNIGSTAQYFNQTFTDRVNATTLSASGNVTGGNVLTGGLISAAGAITGGAITGSSLTVSTGNISGGNINNNNSNGVGNIGSATTYFNRLFATATTALYADVAERFAADEVLEAGTVVELGGVAEITRSRTELSENVFGVISTRAAYLMNGGAGEDDTHPPVAMTGRVPVKVVGIVRKGDRLVSAGAGIARAAQPGEATSFNVIGRSLVDKTTPESGTIEAIVTIKN
ncbi:hypothetical protein [Haliscomenobacter sp.]|uniref:beta strand repeat-containing protein n=1 Tax=Haliscomenobacter sp. TaxID=2717303 RepID=UPI003365190D